MKLALLALLFSSAAFAAAPQTKQFFITIYHYYPVLPPNSVVECRIMENPQFGALFTRGTDDAIHVHFITSDKLEGEESAMTITDVKRGLAGVYMLHKNRWKDPNSNLDIGSNFEFMIDARRDAAHNYDFPGRVFSTTTMFEKDANGLEKENIIPGDYHEYRCKFSTKLTLPN